MGNEFIQKTKRSYRKGIDRERRKLTLADLGLFGTSKKIRTITCVPFGLEHFSEGSLYELNAEEGRISIRANGVRVGVCQDPPRSILLEICSVGGKALGMFYSIRAHSGLVEIAIGLESNAKEGEAA
jgi:hypothetical protein